MKNEKGKMQNAKMSQEILVDLNNQSLNDLRTSSE
jgi:hypothetical protein